jgi:hypothetical protein
MKNQDCQSCINQGCTWCLSSSPGTCQSILSFCDHPETIWTGCGTVDAAREALLGGGETSQRATWSRLQALFREPTHVYSRHGVVIRYRWMMGEKPRGQELWRCHDDDALMTE